MRSTIGRRSKTPSVTTPGASSMVWYQSGCWAAAARASAAFTRASVPRATAGTVRRVQDRLPEPVVSPDEYDRDYYAHTCLGATEWTRSGGSEGAPVYPGFLAIAGMEEGDVVVDIGTGRAELLAVAVERGARRAIGVEYAPAAV